MKIKSTMYSGDHKMGEIWTDGKSVFFSPRENRMLSMIVSDPVVNLKTGKSITSDENPIEFVRNLQFTYRPGQSMYATAPSRED